MIFTVMDNGNGLTACMEFPGRGGWETSLICSGLTPKAGSMMLQNIVQDGAGLGYRLPCGSKLDACILSGS